MKAKNIWSLFIIFLLVVIVPSTISQQFLEKRAVFKNVDGSISGGVKAKEKQFPWQAAIFIQGLEGKSWFCGGAIISNQWILTAGHCVNEFANAHIHLGSNHLGNVDRNRVSVETNIYYRHADYKSVKAGGLANDIALLQLSLDAIEFNEYIQPISLHGRRQFIAPNVEVTVGGFGISNDNTSEQVTDYLYVVNLTTISNEECNNVYSDLIRDEFCCSRGKTIETTCSGDSGSPVIKYTNKGPILVGIVSFGSSTTCEKGLPVGFTRISYFRSWIKEISGV